VLVVDDSRFVRASLVRDLGKRFGVQQAESGERAWELLLLDPSIGGVLSDLTMPGIDGFELLRRVRSSVLPRLRDLPFAVLSGADDAALRERARDLGADRFVVKGVAVDALAEWLGERLADPMRPSDPSSEPSSEPSRSDAPAPANQATRLVVDPLQRWFVAGVGRIPVSGDAAPVLIRLHAAALEELPARLRRGIREADALHLEGLDTAWLCVPASAPLALRLALRFALLAAGRQAPGQSPRCAIEVCVQAVDPSRPQEALAALQASPPSRPAVAELALRCGAGAWGPAWDCRLPWVAARLLVS
jgi:CheY-like chemotaxis protein